MDMGSTEIIFNPENITFDLIIASSMCEVFPLPGEENQNIFSIHSILEVLLQTGSSLDLKCLYTHCAADILE